MEAEPRDTEYESMRKYMTTVESAISTRVHHTPLCMQRPLAGRQAEFSDWWNTSNALALEIYAHTVWILTDRGEISPELYFHRRRVLVQSEITPQQGGLWATYTALCAAVAAAVIRHRLFVQPTRATGRVRTRNRVDNIEKTNHFQSLVARHVDPMAFDIGSLPPDSQAELYKYKRFMMMFWGFAAGRWSKAEEQCTILTQGNNKVTDAISAHWNDQSNESMERTEWSTATSVIEACLAEVMCTLVDVYDLDDAHLTLSNVSSVFNGTTPPMLLALRCGILFSESQRAALAGYTIAEEEMDTVLAVKAVALMRLVELTSIEN